MISVNGRESMPPSSDNATTPSLDQLRPGQRGRVARVVGDDSLVQRLMEMGLLEGEVVEVVGFAPLGDPMEVRLGDYRLSLRRVEAARVHVDPL
jgi:Fe2+ transport system protein FeoA